MKHSLRLQRLFTLLEAYEAQVHQGRFLNYLPPEALRERLQLDEASKDKDSDSALFEWVEKYLRYSVKTAHPRFLNRMWSGANWPSIVGEIVTATTNTSACTYETAPVATLIEHYMLETLLKLVGFEAGEGQMTTGSSQANMLAMLTARNRALQACKTHGLFQQPPLVAFVSEDAHYSLDKAANVIGIGTEHLVKIPVDSRGRMQVDALEEELRHAHQRGWIPFFVCATLGTTVRGAYDPIAPLARLRQTHGFWLHGDGAWGGAVLFDESLRQRYLPDVALLDSFTWDFHKMPGSNLMCNVFLLNHARGILRDACDCGESTYLFRKEDPASHLDLGPASLQCGRKVDSLKWFLDWKYHGQDGFAQRVRHYLHLAEQAEAIVEREPLLELVAPRESFNVCFRAYQPSMPDPNAFNLELRTRLFKEGIAAVGLADVHEHTCLRLLITHPDFTVDDLECLFADILTMIRKLLHE